MKRLILIGVVLLVLMIAGGLTVQLTANQGQIGLPVIRSVANPDGSALEMTPWKAEQLFLLIGFVLFNLLGATVTFALIMWWLNRQVKRSRAGAASRPAETAPTRVE